MTPEDSMRERISAELDAHRPPLGDLVDQAVAEGRRKKRRTRLGAATLSALGVVAVAGAVTQFALASPAPAQNAGGHTAATKPKDTKSPPVAPPSSATTRTTAPPTTPATTPLPVSAIVKNVSPGTFSLEKGIYLNYTTSSMSYWEYEGGLTIQYNGSNTWGSDFVTMGATDRLFTGFYVGDKDVAAAAMIIDGKTVPASVVKVNGAHGWCGLYYLRPPGPTSFDSFRIDVYDTSGKVIATAYTGLGGPPPTHTSPEPTRTLPITNIPLSTPFAGVTVMAPPPGSPTK